MIEEIFERRAKEVNHKDIVKALLSKIVDIGNAGCES